MEGLRFLDQLGKVDSKINDNNGIVAIGSNNITNNHITNEQEASIFIRDKSLPTKLKFSQPKEPQPSHNITKTVIKEFNDLNNRLIDRVTSGCVKKRFNLPKIVRQALLRLKKLVMDKKLDIRKVDKGQKILIIDYEQRTKAEESSIASIAEICENQTSNWNENKIFIEEKMRKLFVSKFITSSELTGVTGLLAGGVCGKLRHDDGSIKYTKAIDSNELFARQKTPYVYPLFKAHKIAFEDLLKVLAEHVATEIPSRLVVGMACCQMFRIQCWLECFLTPLAILYGNFEYIKDSNDMLVEIENIKVIAVEEMWDWDKVTLFTIDVKALYPSVKYDFLKLALTKCFQVCTNWNSYNTDILITIIMYTLSNQQIIWNNQYYILNQGIPTGAKHSVPLANIFLTFIVLELRNNNSEFKCGFENKIKLWKRFIDDCGGIISGNITEFIDFFEILRSHFNKFALDLTCDTDTHNVNGDAIIEKVDKCVNFLDIEIFKVDNTIHTREHRKETSAISYLKYNSAHPRHTFSGIIKSQLYRLRRLCSRNTDFNNAVADLKQRCVKSEYPVNMIDNILNTATNIIRTITNKSPILSRQEEMPTVKLVALSGTSYGKQFSDFVTKMNSLSHPQFNIELVKSTSFSISQLLFHNCVNIRETATCIPSNCFICNNNLNNGKETVTSSITNKSYKVNKMLNCNDGGIYVVTGGCEQQYSGKTTTPYSNRTYEHLKKIKTGTIFIHKEKCGKCSDLGNCSISLVEHYLDRGKYSLSEREYLWNHRIKGTLNIQKTLKS